MGARVMTPKKSWQNELRERIDAEAIIDGFQKCFSGQIELTSAQIKVGESLLKKKLPDLQSVQVSGDGEGGPLVVELVQYAANSNPK